MENKNTALTITLILVCALSVLSALLLFRYVKKVESDYTEKEASLIKENMDLIDQMDNMKITIGEKTKEIKHIERAKEKLTEKIKSIEEENKKLEELYIGRIEVLDNEKEELAKEVKALKEASLVEIIRKGAEAEEDENIRKLLERTLQNIELIKSGNVVDLKPIVVSQGKEAKEVTLSEITASLPQDAVGEVLSVDRQSNLIVINLGAKDKVGEGRRLAIMDDGAEIATGEVINSRYRVSAAFIDDISHKHTIHDIKTGYKVLMEE